MSIESDSSASGLAHRVRAAFQDLFDLHDVTVSGSGLVRLRGRLLRPANEAHKLATERLRRLGYTPIFRREGKDDLILAMPRLLEEASPNRWLGGLLFALTAASMLFVSLMMSQDPRQSLLSNLLGAVPYVATLLAILTAHELGHYFVGRRYGVALSLPYFIPLPVPIFGTMGAVIRLKAPPTNRRALLAMAVAGPLTGLAVALPLLVLGLKLSTVGPLVENGLLEGNSLLYAAVKFIMFGRLLPGGGLDVNLHPVALAAWGGLFVTGLNLIPAGQLDGGHIIYALIGERARYLPPILAAALALLGLLYWPGWFMWAGLLFVFGRVFAVPLDDITRLTRRQVVLAVAMLVLSVLVFVPIPLTPLQGG